MYQVDYVLELVTILASGGIERIGWLPEIQDLLFPMRWRWDMAIELDRNGNEHEQ